MNVFETTLEQKTITMDQVNSWNDEKLKADRDHGQKIQTALEQLRTGQMSFGDSFVDLYAVRSGLSTHEKYSKKADQLRSLSDLIKTHSGDLMAIFSSSIQESEYLDSRLQLYIARLSQNSGITVNLQESSASVVSEIHFAPIQFDLKKYPEMLQDHFSRGKPRIFPGNLPLDLYQMFNSGYDNKILFGAEEIKKGLLQLDEQIPDNRTFFERRIRKIPKSSICDYVVRNVLPILTCQK